MKCIITIPVYKSSSTLSIDELKSFKQCLNILGQYDISIFTHKEIDISLYKTIANDYSKNIDVQYFDSFYFQTLRGYNHLMLKKEFYERYKQYEYMLLYQLDAYVFKDELLYWCQQGYDYIGSPWFENHSEYEKGNILWKVGNGGFSLRHIPYFLYFLSLKWPLRSSINLHEGRREFIRSLIYFFGWHNTLRWHRKYSNEDIFFCEFLPREVKDKKRLPKVPPCEIALKFSFERSPSYLYELNNKELPFGCHAYKKWEYDTFWKKYIK